MLAPRAYLKNGVSKEKQQTDVSNLHYTSFSRPECFQSKIAVWIPTLSAIDSFPAQFARIHRTKNGIQNSPARFKWEEYALIKSGAEMSRTLGILN
jgi:hypothetical protein